MGMQAKDYPYVTVQGDLMQTRIYTLDNGLKVYLSVNKEKPRIQAHIAVRTGSRNDPAETTGLAHYLEHLMFKGTRQFGVTDPAAEAPLLDEIEARYEVYRTLTDPAERKQAYHEIDSVSQLAAQYFIPNEYDKLMSAIGSQGTNAFTSNDVTCYVENIPSRTGLAYRLTVSRIWSSADSTPNWKLCMKRKTSAWHKTHAKCGNPFRPCSSPPTPTAHRPPSARRNI